jgi:hypothetical protein
MGCGQRPRHHLWLLFAYVPCSWLSGPHRCSGSSPRTPSSPGPPGSGQSPRDPPRSPRGSILPGSPRSAACFSLPLQPAKESDFTFWSLPWGYRTIGHDNPQSPADI